jgi:hypothetical protein
MACRLCQSENQGSFGSEMNIHFPRREGIYMPTVMVFPKVVVCLECGFTEFVVEKEELRRLAEGSEEGVVA